MNSGLKESIEKTIEWDDITPDAFLSLWQFLYNGTYDSPVVNVALAQAKEANEEADTSVATQWGSNEESRVDEAEASLLDDQPTADERSDFSHGTGHWPPRNLFQRKRKGMDKSRMWKDFIRLSLEDSELYPPIGIILGSEESEDASVSYADAFIHHARVYVLADRYGIQHLMNIAFGKLHASLVGFPMDVAGPDDVVALLCYCFEHAAPEKLRKLVVLYAACKAKQLWKCKGFGELMATSGEFSREVMESVMLRLD